MSHLFAALAAFTGWWAFELGLVCVVRLQPPMWAMAVGLALLAGALSVAAFYFHRRGD